MKRKPGQQTNQLQARYLRERVAEHERRQRRAIYEASSHSPKEPPAIKRARRMVDRWDTMNATTRDAIRTRRYEALASEVGKTREKILFATPAEALAAVEEFERFVAVS